MNQKDSTTKRSLRIKVALLILSITLMIVAGYIATLFQAILNPGSIDITTENAAKTLVWIFCGMSAFGAIIAVDTLAKW